MSQQPPAQSIEEALPLSLIRRHCKIDDYLGVPDGQLELYRSAAVEAFESYTGRMLGPVRNIRQVVAHPRWTSIVQAARGRTMCGLSHPSTDGLLLLEYGGKTQMVNITPGRMEFEWPITFAKPTDVWTFPFPVAALVNQCDTCGNGAGQPLPYVSYRTGGAALSPGVVVGCLKYIAWQYQHPGDELATVGDRYARVSSGGQQGSNNALVGSGAYAEWRRYRARVAR